MKILMSLLMILSFGFSAYADKNEAPLTTVDSVDLTRYVGKWYEVASIPASFQRKCLRSVTAEYSILDDGDIKVVNSCDEKNGKKNVAVARAKIADAETNAKLKVAFFKFLGHYVFLFAGDYWIIDLDPNYQWAVVGAPNRKFGWILARTPTLPQSTLNEIAQGLADKGYNPCHLQTTVQAGGFEKKESLCNVLK
jgi:apolipoprotein D and lipocalin family protein